MGMRLLKLFVILGGIVLIVGSGILFTRMYEKFHGPAKEKPGPENRETHIVLPADGKILSSSSMGDGVALLVALPSGGGQLLLVNQDGRLWRRVHLELADQ
jgi:hypothetical protein